MKKIDVRYAANAQEAQAALAEGYEPIECSFGRDGSVVGPLQMDHHGALSNLSGVAIRAQESFGIRKDDPRFVVTGAADADAVTAILVLAGVVSLSKEDAELINAVDTDPINVGSLIEKGDSGYRLLAFNQATSGMPNGQGAFDVAIKIFLDLYGGETKFTSRRALTLTEQTIIFRAEISRINNLTSSALRIWEHEEGSSVALACNPMWGFDVWYRQAPIVVSYVEVKKSITIGVVSLTKAEELLGPGGLKNIFPVFDQQLGSETGYGKGMPGWGGRETVGGSPRNLIMSLDQARLAVKLINAHIKGEKLYCKVCLQADEPLVPPEGIICEGCHVAGESVK